MHRERPLLRSLGGDAERPLLARKRPLAARLGSKSRALAATWSEAAWGQFLGAAPVDTTLSSCTQVALSSKTREVQCLLVDCTTGCSSDCVRLRSTAVRVTRLENRQGFTAFVSSNLTLSAMDVPADRTLAPGLERMWI